MPAIYTLKSLALPQIKIFASREDYKLFIGQDAPLPNFDEDPKYWIDLDVLRNPDNYGRHVTYDGVLALNDDGSPRMVDTSTEADPNRQAFYKQFGFRQVPSLEPLQLLKTFCTTVNLAYTGAVSGQPDYSAWLKRPPTPYPVRELASTEAFCPTPFESGLERQVCLMDEFRKQVTSSQSLSDKLDHALAKLDEIEALVRGH